MKKIAYLLLINFLLLACSKDLGSFDNEPPSLIGDELLWGTWKFSYVTNTMEGIRSYTFHNNGKYSYQDEWTVRDKDWNIISQEQEKRDGTYSIQTYNKTEPNSAEGEIIIGEKKYTLIIGKDSNNNQYLLLGNSESFIKERPES